MSWEMTREGEGAEEGSSRTDEGEAGQGRLRLRQWTPWNQLWRPRRGR